MSHDEFSPRYIEGTSLTSGHDILITWHLLKESMKKQYFGLNYYSHRQTEKRIRTMTIYLYSPKVVIKKERIKIFPNDNLHHS